jgi:hypothetical protein
VYHLNNPIPKQLQQLAFAGSRTVFLPGPRHHIGVETSQIHFVAPQMQVVVREVVHHIVQHPPNHLVRLVQRWVQRVFVAGFEDVGVMRGMTVAV